MSEITIRASTPQDAVALHAMMQDPDVYAQTLQIPHNTLSLWDKRLKDADDNDLIYSIAADAEGRMVGHATLMLEKNPRRRHVAALGISVASGYQRKGVGRSLMQALLKMADNWLNLHRVELSVFTDHTAAIALYESCGFITEGVARDFAFRDGKYADALLMARVRPASQAESG